MEERRQREPAEDDEVDDVPADFDDDEEELDELEDVEDESELEPEPDLSVDDPEVLDVFSLPEEDAPEVLRESLR